MTVRTTTHTHTFTEQDLLALAQRFEVRGDAGGRRFYVAGVEVPEAEYRRAFDAATARPA